MGAGTDAQKGLLGLSIKSPRPRKGDIRGEKPPNNWRPFVFKVVYYLEISI